MLSLVPTEQAQSLHAQIQNGILRRIREGALRPGDRLPSDAEMMKQYNVSRGTVTRALRDLEITGVLYRRRGSGTFVRDGESAVPKKSRELHIAMFMPWATTEQTAGPFHIQLHHGISRVCGEHQASLSLQCLSSVGADRRERLLNAARAIIAREPQVVLYCGLELPHDEMPLNEEVLGLLRQAGLKIIVIDRDVAAYPDRSPYTWVSFDNRRGSTLLVKHLVDEGYRRIAFVGITDDSTAVFDRLSGYHDGHRLCNLPHDRELVIQTDHWPDEALCEQVLKAKPDAIICKDTFYAAKLGFMLTQRGHRIGHEIGLAGFDDDPIASMLPVPLTVVRQPIEPFAAAVYQVAALITGSSSSEQLLPPGSHLVIPTELVPRASTHRGR